jgi:hypothetical protein
MDPVHDAVGAALEADPLAAPLLRESRALVRRARWVEVSAALGLSLASASGAYVTDRMLSSLAAISRWGSGGTPTPWPPMGAAALGAILGYLLARPFADWLRLQARLVEVHLRTGEHTRRAGEHTEQTARGIRGLADATATFATINARTDQRLTAVDDEE